MKLLPVLFLLLPVAALGSPVEAKPNELTSETTNRSRLEEGVANSETHDEDFRDAEQHKEALDDDVLTSSVSTAGNTDLAEPNATQPPEINITELPPDVINHIKSYLTYKDEIIFQGTCTSLYTTDKLKSLETKCLKRFRFHNTFTNNDRLAGILAVSFGTSRREARRALEFARETERLLVGAVDLERLLVHMLDHTMWRRSDVETRVKDSLRHFGYFDESTYKTRLDKALKDYNDDWKIDDLVGMILVQGATHDPEAFKDKLRRKYIEVIESFDVKSIVTKWWIPVDESHYWDDLVQAFGTDLVELRKIRKAIRTARPIVADERKYGNLDKFDGDKQMSALMSKLLVERNRDEILSAFRQARETLRFQLAVQYNLNFAAIDIVKSSGDFMDPFFLRTLKQTIVSNDVKIRDLLMEHRFLNMDNFKSSWLNTFGEEYLVTEEEVEEKIGGWIGYGIFSYISHYFRRT